MIPTTSNIIETVSIPAHRVLTVKRFTSEETGEFYAPVSNMVAAVKVENDVHSVAKTMKPARRRGV